jgi:hypothetical protein
MAPLGPFRIEAAEKGLDLRYATKSRYTEPFEAKTTSSHRETVSSQFSKNVPTAAKSFKTRAARS